MNAFLELCTLVCTFNNDCKNFQQVHKCPYHWYNYAHIYTFIDEFAKLFFTCIKENNYKQ